MKYNKMILGGRLGRDAEVRAFGNDRAVINFNLATDMSFKKDGAWVNKTEWTPCSYFTTQKGADYLANKLLKGATVLVEGQKETQEYEKDGMTRQTVRCAVKDIQVLSGGNENEGGSGYQPQAQQQNSASNEFPNDFSQTDDAPF